jgi:hypothetical protein
LSIVKHGYRFFLQFKLKFFPKEQVEKLVGQMEAEMRRAAHDLEFERAAALRDEIQQIRLRVLEEDASAAVGRAAEKAASGRHAGDAASQSAPARAGRTMKPVRQATGRGGGAAGDDGAGPEGPDLEVTQVRVLPAGEEPGVDEETAQSTASDWLPGIRDEHEDDGWAAKWIDKPTWDHTVTPNVIKRSGTRPQRGRRRR